MKNRLLVRKGMGVLLAVTLSVGLTACGDSTTEQGNTVSESTETAMAQENAADTAFRVECR